MPRIVDGPHEVYRLLAADGSILYVGCTSNLERRMYNHARAAYPWWGEYDHVESRTYPDRDSALAAEKVLIENLRPPHNRVHNADAKRYRSHDVVGRIPGITYRQLDHWRRHGAIVPAVADAAGSGTRVKYSDRDICRLRVIADLMSLLDVNALGLSAIRAIWQELEVGDEMSFDHGAVSINVSFASMPEFKAEAEVAA